MIINIVYGIILMVLAGLISYLAHTLSKSEDHIIKLAMKVSELEDYVDRIDKSTGAAVHELRNQFMEFKTDYGDAAIDEMKESARAQKEFADGLSSIMNFRAYPNERGDAK